MPSSPSPQDRFRPSSEVLVQELGGKAVLLDLKSEKYFQLNGTGTRVWQLLGENRTLDEIAQAIAREASAPAETVKADVTTLIGELSAAGLIEAQR